VELLLLCGVAYGSWQPTSSWISGTIRRSGLDVDRVGSATSVRRFPVAFLLPTSPQTSDVGPLQRVPDIGSMENPEKFMPKSSSLLPITEIMSDSIVEKHGSSALPRSRMSGRQETSLAQSFSSLLSLPSSRRPEVASCDDVPLHISLK